MRVVSLNVWALPWGMARHTAPRMQAIGAALPDLDVDVAAFQEVWTEEARRSLMAAGERAGLVHAWHNRGKRGASGLLVLSRLRIAEARFDPYLLRGYPERVWHGDYWGGKGFALLGLETPAGPLAFVDTHLHAQYAEQVGDEYSGHVMGQVVQLAVVLGGIGVPLIAAGDFNLRPEQPQYPALVGLAGLRDAAVEGGGAVPTTLRSNPYRDLPDARIDYVFVRDGGGRAIRVLSAARIFDEALELEGEPAAPSDHAGLRVELEIGPGGAASVPAPSADAIALAHTRLVEARRIALERRRHGRLASAGALAGAGAAFVGSRSQRLARRGFLRGMLVAGGLLALPVGCGLGVLSEGPESSEIAAYDALLQELGALDRGHRSLVRHAEGAPGADPGLRRAATRVPADRTRAPLPHRG